jgi:hypothetical protein
MTPVQADWLTLLFAPMGVILLVIAFAATRSAAKSKAPVPVWCKVTQGVGCVCVVLAGVVQLLAGS